MRKQKKYHYIYKTTCNVTGRYYVGMHSTDKLDDGYMGSGKRLWYSFNYHGKDNHSVEILEYYDTRNELRDREVELVNEDLLKEDLCMNLKSGGDGGFVDEGHSEKFREGNRKFVKNRWDNDTDYRNKITKVLNDNLKRSIENGSLLGRTNFKDKIHSEASKEKMRKAKKGTGTGEANSQYGTCWITKDGSSKKIKKEALNEYLAIGWVMGRKG